MAGKIRKELLTQKQIEQLETMSGVRLPMPMIAAILGISKATLERRMNDQPGVKEAVERGRAVASYNVHSRLYEMAQNNPTLMIFWMKTREGLRETDRLELTGADGKPLSVTELSREKRQAKLKKYKRILDETDDE